MTTVPVPASREVATWLYIGAAVTIAVALLVVCGTSFGWGQAPLAYVLLTAMVAASRGTELNELGGKVNLSLASLLPSVGLLIQGPAGAAILGVIAGFLEVGRLPWRALLFNASMYSIMGSASGLTYWALNGDMDLETVTYGHLLVPVLLPFFVAMLILALINAVLLSGIMRINARVPFRAQVVELVSSAGVPYAANGVLALLIALLWLPVGLRGYTTILMAAPVFAAQWAFTQYGDERLAHERTVSSLVGAIETKAPGLVGQADAVGALSRALAAELGLAPTEIQAIGTAGTLHDLGLVNLPAVMLSPDQPAGADDLETLLGHPSAGVELLHGISFVQASLDALAFHHERFDGTGYPDGLQGDQIPLGARVVAVADAFVALRTPRAGRPALGVYAALDQVDGMAGTVLDPAVVRVLPPAVLSRRLWTAPEHVLPARADSVLAHDEPGFRRPTLLGTEVDPA